ncbi:Ubiquitin interacting motif [Babesia duncani]|uniref:Ubiquitin interacting motif n=1 Tax=Babesia duncani TaxID=323732 RepID=A0AAD9PIL9_9APIC|nr:Ubiquitin interacting motif [Babesia duncani]KAK2194773.1 Ubiquitin interacting motif [Babesia duncani]KAK2195122.1 Ubiquitin interacting motif [Babesia duncani]
MSDFDDEELQLAIALSASQAEHDRQKNTEATASIKRPKILALPKLKDTSKRLLVNVYATNGDLKSHVDALILEAFKTLRIIGSNDTGQESQLEMSLDVTLMALKRIGFNVTRQDLDKYMIPYQSSPDYSKCGLRLVRNVKGKNKNRKWNIPLLDKTRKYS